MKNVDVASSMKISTCWVQKLYLQYRSTWFRYCSKKYLELEDQVKLRPVTTIEPVPSHVVKVIKF